MGQHVFVGYERRFSPVNFNIMFEGEGPARIETIFDRDGTEVSGDCLTQTAIQNVPVSENPNDEIDKIIPIQIRLNTDNWTVRDKQGKVWPISYIVADTSLTTIKTFPVVTTHSYSGGGKSYEVATAETQFADNSGKLIMLKGKDGGVSINWAPE